MKVVNVRNEQATHYIGRIGSYNPQKHGVNAMLGNPFMIGSVGEHRPGVIQAFEDHVRKDPVAMQRIKNLPPTAVLGCWCKPLACHGDVIVKLWNELHGQTCEDEGCPHYGEPHDHK